MLLLAALVCLFAAAPASAAVRNAVPGGSTTDLNCTSTPCTLKHLLEDVVTTNDEVIVAPGTHDVGSMGLHLKNNVTSVNIHGQDGQPRPRVTATATVFVFGSCFTTCVNDGMTLRHLAIDNQGTGGGLALFGGAGANPVTVDDVSVTAGSAALGILIYSQTDPPTQAVIRNSIVRSSNPSSGNGAAIASTANLTLRNVTAVATGNTASALTQGAMGNDGNGCTGDATATVTNSILVGGPNALDARTNVCNATTTGHGTVCDLNCYGHINLDYSNFDASPPCTPTCFVSTPGSAHNQTAAPLFVNTAGGDFHQQAGSPTVDAGVDDPANGSTDFDGNARKLGAATDIGAFEDGHPRATTGAATEITQTGGTLQGTVNPIGFATTYQFQWGTTTVYGNQLPASPLSAGSGTAAQVVAQNLGGLTPGTTVHYRLTATSSFGTAFGNDQTFTTLVPVQPVQPDRTPPGITGLALSNARFRVASGPTPVTARTRRAPLGTRFRYSLSERATVTLTIQRSLPGRRVGRSCRKPTRSNRTRRRCTRFVLAGRLTRRNLGPGRVSTRFSGRIGRRKLAVGKYRATVGATDAAGNRATARRISFYIVP